MFWLMLFVEGDDFRLFAFVDAFLRDDDLAWGAGLRDVVHDIEHDVLDDALEGAGAGLALDGFFRDGAQGVFGEFELDVIHGEEFLVLFDRCVLRLGQDAQQGVFVEGLERADDRQAADDFRDDAVLHEVFRADLMDELVVGRLLVLAGDFGAEANGRIGFLQAFGDDVFDADEGTADDEQDVLRVDLDGRGLRMFALAVGRELDDVAFEHFEEGLLYAFMTRVGRDGVVGTGLSRNLVELIEVDDAVLGFLDVLVGSVIEVADGDFDIGADEAGFCEARGIRDGERHVEEFREVREQGRFAAAGRAEHDDVRFLDFRAIVTRVAVFHAFVVVVDGDGQDFLRAVLIDDVLIEVLLDDMRFVLLENLIELCGEVRRLFFLSVGLVHLDVMREFLDAVLADAEARGRVVNRHVEGVMDFDFALAEAAALLHDWFFRFIFIISHIENTLSVCECSF